MLCGAAAGYSSAPALQRAMVARSRQLTMSADLDKVYRRAEFWEDGECTLLEMINVVGRFDSASEWATRTEFAVVDSLRMENLAQGASVERHEYARRNGYVERVALVQNAPKLPFKNAGLAAWAGKTVDEMNAMPVSKTATDIVYDALAQSKSSLLKEDAVDKRRASWLIDGGTGGFDEGAFMSGMVKSRIAVVVGFFLLGKGQLYGYVLAGKLVLDYTGTFDLMKSTFGPFTEPIFWVLTLGAVYYTYQQSREVTRKTGDFATVSKEEATAMEEKITAEGGRQATVFEKWNKAIYKGDSEE